MRVIEIADDSNGRRYVVSENGGDEVNAIITVCAAVSPRVGGMKRVSHVEKPIQITAIFHRISTKRRPPKKR
jgi:vacuolar-type H+-ATPase catalytic subunit A/Vma1